MQARNSIVITGAANGIGRDTVRLFHRRDWFVGCYDVDKDRLATLKEELGGEHLICEALDVRDRDAFVASMKRFGEQVGRLDILFNNAGVAEGGFFDESEFEAQVNMVNVNIIGVLNGIHAALPLLKATPNSLCLTTASSAAIFGIPGIAVYSATKHAVKGLTEALSVEFSRFGTRAADILPGMVDTRQMPEDMRAASPTNGMWRLIPPAYIADTVWRAYQSEQLHWYVPAELSQLEMDATNPERTRDAYKRSGSLDGYSTIR